MFFKTLYPNVHFLTLKLKIIFVNMFLCSLSVVYLNKASKIKQSTSANSKLLVIELNLVVTINMFRVTV